MSANEVLGSSLVLATLIGFVFSGGAVAQQFTVTALAAPQPTVTATSATGTRSSSIPPGPITSAVTIAASASGFGESAQASMQVVPGPTTVTVNATADRFSSFPTGFTTSRASGAIDIDFSGPGSGSLLFGYRVSASVGPSFSIDVGADGTPEVLVTAAGLTSDTFVVPRTTAAVQRVRLSVDLATRAFGYGSINLLETSISYVPTNTIAFRSREPACYSGSVLPSLTGRDTPNAFGHRLDFRIDNGFSNAFAALVFGVVTANDPILLPPGCNLYLEPVTFVFLTTDATGFAGYRFQLPATLPAAKIYMQAIPFDFTPRAVGSNRLDVVLVP